jgi:hypothetical protein
MHAMASLALAPGRQPHRDGGWALARGRHRPLEIDEVIYEIPNIGRQASPVWLLRPWTRRAAAGGGFSVSSSLLCSAQHRLCDHAHARRTLFSRPNGHRETIDVCSGRRGAVHGAEASAIQPVVDMP